MELSQYRAAQDQESKTLARTVLQVLSLLAGSPLTPRQLVALTMVLLPGVRESRLRSFELARQVILALNPRAPQVPVPEYRPEFLASALGRYLLGKTEDPRTAQTAIANAVAAVVRHTEQAGREGMISMVEADPKAEGWARVARGGRTCAFCLLLVSRGPVYREMRTAVFQSHPKCDCIAVPVYDRDNWHGREQWLAAEKLYSESTRGERDKLNAFRRAATAGDIGSELPAAA